MNLAEVTSQTVISIFLLNLKQTVQMKARTLQAKYFVLTTLQDRKPGQLMLRVTLQMCEQRLVCLFLCQHQVLII